MTMKIWRKRKTREKKKKGVVCYCTDLLDHLLKLLLLILLKSFVVLHRGHIQLMLGLGLRGLKRAGQDGEFDIFQNLSGDRKTTFNRLYALDSSHSQDGRLSE